MGLFQGQDFENHLQEDITTTTPPRCAYLFPVGEWRARREVVTITSQEVFALPSHPTASELGRREDWDLLAVLGLGVDFQAYTSETSKPRAAEAMETT